MLTIDSDTALEISKKAEQIKLDNPSLTIEAAVKQAQRNFNKINGWHEIIKAVSSEDER